MRLLCLSNGHGEDIISLRILQALQRQAPALELSVLPIVGEGHVFSKAGIPLIGTVKTLPSGGFIYMDGRQLARDLRGGLVQLTLTQLKAVRRWATQPGAGILAVGDIVPLAFAWWSRVPYAFVGTAKSEYYLRDESGWLPRQSWFDDRLERWTGCIYHPWERWLMSQPQCRAVFPRDTITAQNLRQLGLPAIDLGNPMMDGLEWQADFPTFPTAPSQDDSHPLTIALIPGSRPPEAYANWETILLAVNGIIAQMKRPLTFLATIAPGLDLDILHQTLLNFRWQLSAENTYSVGLGQQKATLELGQSRFAEYIHRADLAIAMAGTATEQFVGMGKPVLSIPGRGPQFTPRFAEAQTRLLGCSVTLVEKPELVSAAISRLLQNPDRLQLIAENGQRRMGQAGAADRIASHLLERLKA